MGAPWSLERVQRDLTERLPAQLCTCPYHDEKEYAVEEVYRTEPRDPTPRGYQRALEHAVEYLHTLGPKDSESGIGLHWQASLDTQAFTGLHYIEVTLFSPRKEQN